ncbi:MAG: TIGR00289 family protein [Candidatus Altiarchaeales archaeon]|nr:TIGR00289 family protein [Candidatus Altiarchaeales archaeon]MBD3416369.1 TIGR00289 family protein [Candidatus Altiarchaeales archaeon]
MKVGVLFSGGKDSAYALYKALDKEDVVCLITIVSENPESYMFHTPNIALTELQAEAMGMPLVKVATDGVKEEELEDLKKAIETAKVKYGIEGVVTGAVESVYQGERVQRVCDELGLWCFNPLWKMDQIQLLEDILEFGFEVIVSGVFAEPFTREWLGRRVGPEAIDELEKMGEEHMISPSGEGGEIETTVLDAPFFNRRIEVTDSRREFKGISGAYHISDARLADK